MGDFRTLLRTSTREWHDRVDRAFSRYPLQQAATYRAFLAAHARALIPLEQWIVAEHLLPGWTGRSAAVADDLAALAAPPPPAPRLDWTPTAPARWGALYVIEGSRLGASVLVRDVPQDLPTGYLGARQAPGLWRSLLDQIESHAAAGGAAWRDQALAGANRAFALFAEAARETHPAHH
ncbi:biliverdin-producing heme oxygenase [Novosphingobium sp. KCTC 2891]|uniref:biliverdin-producing heme oxygenase n=1 Tax=Novosphingobium sp. KCTC 2891 TaxID=2989730 RepID=UPI00222176CE|nr:biliverdin-producing heme oxygenase [Novosphingobium sp. KCTC 2891]MCW1383395.1 biliverdin-producing heme oxygenase [Novosphingobium sp. KCTC 2891]